jgi:hypothetical protein
MAIVQISRITVRKGLAEDGPQAPDPLRRTQLAGGEFGWCTDTRQLFIGNGTTGEPPSGDGAPVIGNTEILTEFSDITSAISYTYEDIAVGYPAQTGSTPSDPVIRTVQARLDDFASVRGFGAQGDGVTDDTAAINRALFQLYSVQSNVAVRRTLYFPAGVYRVTGTILIPAYAKLVGEGKDSTIISFNPLTWTSTIGYAQDELVNHAGGFRRAKIPVPQGIDINNTTYWTSPVSLPETVARLTDSLQQVGSNIGTNNAIPPRNIEISSMTFQTNTNNDGMLIEKCQDSWFESVGFSGPLTAAGILSLSSPLISGVCIQDENSEIVFDRCDFQGFRWGVLAADDLVTSLGVDMRGLTVTNSGFRQLFRGAEISGISTGTRMVHNQFDLIAQQAIIYDCQLNISGYNVFYNVGNNLNTAPNPTPQTSVLLFEFESNASIGDWFERSDLQARTQPRVSFGSGVSVTASPLQLGRYARVSGRVFTLQNDISNQIILAINPLQVPAFVMDYTITRSTSIRTGRMTVIAGMADDSTPNSAWTDDYSQNTDTGIMLYADEVGSNIVVKYNSDDRGTAGTFKYSINYLS